MSKIRTTAFTAVQQWPGTKPLILTWATANTASSVRREVGEAYATDEGEGAASGWKKAKAAGIRVLKVEMTVV